MEGEKKSHVSWGKKGIKPKFVDGRRFTDDITMNIVDMVLLERINSSIVEELNRNEVKAKGFSGKTDGFMGVQELPGLGLVGEPIVRKPEVLDEIIMKVSLPIFYSVAVGPNRTGNANDLIPFNVNADDFALEIAQVRRAHKLVFLTDTGGVMDPQGEFNRRNYSPKR